MYVWVMETEMQGEMDIQASTATSNGRGRDIVIEMEREKVWALTRSKVEVQDGASHRCTVSLKKETGVS